MASSRNRRAVFQPVVMDPTALDKVPEIERRAADVRAEKNKAKRVEKALALVDFILTP